MGVSIVRILARLMAMGALTGAAILLIITCIGTPVINTRGFSFSRTLFANGGELRLGMWGAEYTINGVTTTTGTSVGYNLNATQLPGYSANAGYVDPRIVQKPLTTALIFGPLAVGQTLLCLLFALIPVRIVTMIAIAGTFLAVGASAIAFVLELVFATYANGRIGLLFPPQTADAQYDWSLWFTLAATVSNTGAMLFLLIAMPPARNKPLPPAELGLREKYVGTDYVARRDSERWQGERYGRGSTGVNGRSGSIYNPDRDSHSVRSASRRSRRNDAGSARRSRRSERSYASDEDEAERQTDRSSKRRRRAREASEDEETASEQGGYTGY